MFICIHIYAYPVKKRAVPQIINQVKVIFNPHTPNLLINMCNVWTKPMLDFHHDVIAISDQTEKINMPAKLTWSRLIRPKHSISHFLSAIKILLKNSNYVNEVGINKVLKYKSVSMEEEYTGAWTLLLNQADSLMRKRVHRSGDAKKTTVPQIQHGVLQGKGILSFLKINQFSKYLNLNA